jgi:hypothetical protein
MDTPKCFLQEDQQEELLRVKSAEWARTSESNAFYTEHNVPQERHFIFYCEYRFVNWHIHTTWKLHYPAPNIEEWYADKGHGVNHFSVTDQFDVRGKCEVRPCYPCAKHERDSFNSRVYVLEPPLDKAKSAP